MTRHLTQSDESENPHVPSNEVVGKDGRHERVEKDDWLAMLGVAVVALRTENSSMNLADVEWVGQ